MPELEVALVELGRAIEYPPTPELAPRVRARLAEGRRPRFRLAERRTLVIALAVLAVAVGALMAVPGTRAAILDFFGLRGVRIERVETLPTVPSQRGDLGLGDRVSLDEARKRVGFELVMPAELGEPDEVYFRDHPAGGMVSFVYGSAEKPRALFTQFEARVEEVIFKKAIAETEIEPVTVAGEPGYFLSGEAHVFGYMDTQGQIQLEDVRLVVDNVLVWEQGPLTLRLEADVPRAEALRIAGSLRAA
jgi:hypothetical protein